MNSGAAVIRRQQRRSEDLWVEVLEEMSSASLRRRQGDKCLLFVQLSDNYKQTWSRCLLTPKRLFCKCAFVCVLKCFCFYT